MTNTNISLMDIINEQVTTRRTRGSNYTEYGSKKKLFASGILSEQQQEVINQLKGTFNFTVHNDGKYVIITMFDRKAEVKYSFLIVNLENLSVLQAPSIKIAKETVNELVKCEDVQKNEEVTKEDEVSKEGSAQEEPAKEEDKKEEDKPKRNRKGKKQDEEEIK